jgi:hypothetical protein
MEQREPSRRSSAKGTGTIWTATAALIVLVVVIAGLNGHAPQNFWSRAALFAAVALLLYRQISRRFKRALPRAANPDPKSRLNLS